MDAFSAYTSELKSLSNIADGLINTFSNHKKQLEKWCDLVKQAAEDIASDTTITSKTNESSNDVRDKRKLPDIVTFVSQTEKPNVDRLRVSSALRCLQKDHILHIKRTSSRRPSQQKPVLNGTFVKFATPDNSMEEQPGSNVNSETFVNSLNGDGNQEFYTPVGQNPEMCNGLQTETTRASRKRKSSSPIVSTYKKPKVNNSENVSVQMKSTRKSLRHLGKISETKHYKYHSRLPSGKISGSGINSSILKENRTTRMKQEIEENQTIKKVQAARQLKAQEAKRKREEKMQKISQQRLKLEKEKDERLRSRKPKDVEKPLLKQVLDSKKKRPREMEKNTNSEALSEPPASKRTRGKAPASPAPTSKKKVTEKENKIENTQTTENNCSPEIKENLNTTHEIVAKKIETPKKTPRKNNEINTNKSHMPEGNKTYIASAPSSANATNSSVPKEASPVKVEVFKTPVAPQRSVAHTPTLNGSTAVVKPKLDKTPGLPAKPSVYSQLGSSSNCQSYEMTPSRESFTNYDISEIKSDDSDDEDVVKKPQKPVPGWAHSVRLKNALVQQQYSNIDPDMIFGNVYETPDLSAMMGIRDRRYFKRTSSACWNSPSAFK